MEYEIDEVLHEDLLVRIRKLIKPLQPDPTDVEPKLQPISDVKAVFLDIYGTLLTAGLGDIGIHEADAHTAPVTEALEAAGFVCMGGNTDERGAEHLEAAIAEDHARTKAEGIDYPEVDIRSIWETVVCALEDEGEAMGDVTPATIQRLAVEYECRVNPTWPMPELKPTLTAMKGARLVLGLVSNAQFYTPLLLELFDNLTGWLDGMFPEDLCAWSYKLGAGKPSARLMEFAIENLSRKHGFTPQQVLYVGNDMKKDIMPAAKLGCHTALFAGDTKSLRMREDDPDVAGITPDAVITRLSQLGDVLGVTVELPT